MSASNPCRFPDPETEQCIKAVYLVPGDDCRIHVVPGSSMGIYFCIPKSGDPLIEIER